MRERNTLTAAQRLEQRQQRKSKPAKNYYQLEKYKALRYNYAEIKEEHRELVQNAAVEILAHGKRAKESIIGMGQRLIDVKAILPEWTFTAWVKAEFELSERMAQNMMNVARQYGERPEIISVLNDTVLYLLSAPSTPDSARDEVEKIAIAEGKSPKVARVQRVVQAHKPTPPESEPDIPADLRQAGVIFERASASWKYTIPRPNNDPHTGYFPELVDAIRSAREMLRLIERRQTTIATPPEPASDAIETQYALVIAPEPLPFDAWLAAMPTELMLRDHLAILELAKGSATRLRSMQPALYNPVSNALPTWSQLIIATEKELKK